MQDSKLINDPVFGFIEIPVGLLYNVVKHPFIQRLNRIKQLGLSSVVYPGAQHTRFQHSIGAFFLMGEALKQLKGKGHEITDKEEEAALAAILLHDIGHGPFSHALENTIVKGVSHEQISLLLMEQMNKEMNGKLNLAIQIFKNEYSKEFLHQLINGQLDMDRLDYLRRDSFFTGVPEGTIGSDRIIKMLNIKDDKLVVDEKGVYSIESFLIARRLMYWQVYLHKSSIAYETMLIKALLRAKELARNKIELFASPSLHYFLYNEVNKEKFHESNEGLENFIQLDDSDIWSSLKVWTNHDDPILSRLSKGMVHRKLFKIDFLEEPPTQEKIDGVKKLISKNLNISLEETNYYIESGSIEKNMYNPLDDHIELLCHDNSVKNISEVSDILNITLLSKKATKYYFCHLDLDS